MKKNNSRPSGQTRSFLMGFATCVLLMALSATAFAAYNQNMTVTYDNVKINVNGTQFTPKDVTGRVVEPFIYQGTTYLPVRAVGEATGYTVTWDQNSKTVYMTLGGGSQGGTPSGPATAPATNLVDTLQPFSYTDKYCFETYPSTGGKSVTMGGTNYKNALMFNGIQYTTQYVSYNLGGKYSTLGGIVGIVDGTLGNGGNLQGDQALSIYGDGVLLKTIDLPLTGLPSSFSISVSGVSELKFELPGHYNCPDVALADLKLS